MELKTRSKIKVRRKRESIRLIIPINENEIWVSDERDRNLTLISRGGTFIRESVNLCDEESFIYDAKKYGNDILATCYLVSKILRLSGDGETVSSFYDTHPFITMGLCVTDNQQVLLCLKSDINVLDKRAKVVRIDSEGKELQTISSESSDVLSFFWPDRLIAIEDDVTIVVNDTSPSSLLFFNKEGRKFQEWNGYVGKKPVYIGYITHKNDKLFMTDPRAKSVYVLNTDGTGARCLIDGTKENLLHPSGIAFNHEQLLVGTWNGTITIFEYLQDESGSITFRDVEEYLRTVASEKTEKARNIRIMLVGNEQVGKTSLCKNMLEENLPEGGPERTDGIDIYIERFVIDLKTKGRKKIPEGAEHQNILQKLRDSVLRHQEQTLDLDTTRKTNEEKEKADSTNHKNVNRNYNDQKHASTDSSSRENNISSNSVMYTRSKKQNKKGNEGKPQDMPPEKSIREKVPVPEGLYEDLHQVLTQHEEDDHHETCYASFWDFSGEKDYYNAHHVFLTSDAVYLLVFKLTDCLDSDNWLERLIFWLRSITSYSVENVAEKHKDGPPIILIGTHLDQLQGTDGDINALIREIFNKLVKNETALEIVNSHVRGFYQVSNIRNIKNEIPKIWEGILSSAPLQSQWERKLPCWWLERERVLMKRKALNVKMQTFAEIKHITKHLPEQCNTDKDVQMFLRYMHMTGDIIVSNTSRPEEAIIIIDPQWLVHAFRRLITSPKSKLPFSGGRFDVLWPIYENTAILPMELIEIAWERDKKECFIKFKDKLLTVMENFGLVARALWDEDEIKEGYFHIEQRNTEFIVPCMLPEATPKTLSDVLSMKNVVNTCTLCFVFENGLMQFSVFDKIIAGCIQRLEPFTDDLSSKMKFVQRGFVCFHLTCKWKVVICCKDEVMKVTLFKFSTSKDIEAGAGFYIRKLLEKLLENVWKITHEKQLEYHYEFHNNYEVKAGERRIKANDLKQARESLGVDGNGPELKGTDYDVWFPDRTDKSQVPIIEDDEIVKQGINAESLDKIVTKKTVSDISHFIGQNFYLLFAELDISMSEIDKVLLDRKFPNYREQILKLLHTWHSAKGQEATHRVIYQAILKHGIYLQCKAKEEDIKSKRNVYKGMPKFTDHRKVEVTDQNLTHEMPIDISPSAQISQQRDVLSEKDEIIRRFKNCINSLQQYLLYDTWVGYIPDETDAWKIIKNVRIVALYNDQFLPICPLPDTFLDIPIYWRQRDQVSTEASMVLKHEDIQKNRQRKFSKETSKALFRKHSKLTIIHPSAIKSKCFASSEQHIEKTPCIALYCQIKGIIPLGETEFNREIDGWAIDVREGFCRFTDGGKICPGTAIVGNATGQAGTIGGFVELLSGRTAFITAFHVVVDMSIREYNRQQREEYLQKENENVKVYRDTDPCDHIGNVIDWCFMSGDKKHGGGVDAALVEVNKDLISTENMFPPDNANLWKDEGYDENDLPKICTDKILKRKEVNKKSMLDSRILKYGMKTHITSGTFKYDGASIKVHNCNLDGSSTETVELYGLFAVEGKFGKKFSEPGDSGALCCIIDKDERTKMHPFGMLVAGDESTGVGYISLLEDTFRELNLDQHHAIKLYPPNDPKLIQSEANATAEIPVKQTEKVSEETQEIKSELKKHEKQIIEVKCELGSLNTKVDKLLLHLLPKDSSDQDEAAKQKVNTKGSHESPEEMETE